MTHSQQKCPDGWTQEQLLAYLEGDLEQPTSRSLEQHLKACPVCAEELVSLRQMDALLRAHPEVFHPDAEQLSGFVSRGEDCLGKVTAHLESCEQCRMDVELLREMTLHQHAVTAPKPMMPKSLVRELESQWQPQPAQSSLHRLFSAAIALFKLPLQAPVLALGSAAAIMIFVAITVPMWREFRNRGLAEFETAPQKAAPRRTAGHEELDRGSGLRDRARTWSRENTPAPATPEGYGGKAGELAEKPASRLESSIERQRKVQSPPEEGAPETQPKPVRSLYPKANDGRIPPGMSAQGAAPVGLMPPPAPVERLEGLRYAGDERKSEIAPAQTPAAALEADTGAMSKVEESVPKQETTKGKLALPAAPPAELEKPASRRPEPSGPAIPPPTDLPRSAPAEKRAAAGPSDSARTRMHGFSRPAAPAKQEYRAESASSQVGAVPLRVEITDNHGRNVPWVTFTVPPDLQDRYRVVRTEPVPESAAAPETTESLQAASGDLKDTGARGLHLLVRVHEAGDAYDIASKLVDAASGREIASRSAMRIRAEGVSESIQSMVRELLQEH